MELAFLIYGISVLDKLLAASCVLLFLSVIATVFCFMAAVHDNTAMNKLPIISAFVFAVIAIFTPNQKTMYTMTAAYTAQKVAESSDAKVIYEKVLKVVNTKLDETIAEGKEGKK